MQILPLSAFAPIGVMQELIGPDLLLMAADFFVKYGNPDADAFVAWHQDVTCSTPASPTASSGAGAA